MKKCVIFDLDGTLFDTTLAMAACGNFALGKLGLPLLTPRQYASASGADLEGFINAVLEMAGDTEHRYADPFWQYYIAKNEAGDDVENRPYEGIKEVLFDLKAKGIRLAVLSNKDNASCTPIVEGAFGKGVFDDIRGQREDTPPKPHSAGVDALLQQFGLKKEDCLYVGDTQVDMQTGKNAEVDTVAVLWGYRLEEELRAFSPEFVISHPRELLDCL